MIRREQVADLQPGDRVRVTGWYDLTVEGRVDKSPADGNSFWLGQHCRLTFADIDDLPSWTQTPEATLTVVSRAPRPLYVNHPRTEAAEHDVVRDGAGVIRHHGPISASADPTWWSWEVEPGFRWTWTSTPPQPLTLLVDGETGQVVP